MNWNDCRKSFNSDCRGAEAFFFWFPVDFFVMRRTQLELIGWVMRRVVLRPATGWCFVCWELLARWSVLLLVRRQRPRCHTTWHTLGYVLGDIHFFLLSLVTLSVALHSDTNTAVFSVDTHHGSLADNGSCALFFCKHKNREKCLFQLSCFTSCCPFHHYLLFCRTEKGNGWTPAKFLLLYFCSLVFSFAPTADG